MNVNTTKAKLFIKRHRIAIGILISFFLIVTSVIFYLSLRWKPIITKQIKESVLTSTDSLYSIDFEDINVNLFTGSVDVQKIVFKPDPKVFEELKGKLRAPRHLFQVEIDGLFLNNVYPWKIYFEQNLHINSVVIERPRVKVFFEPLSQIDSLENDKRTAYQRLSKYLKSVKVGSVLFRDVDFQYVDKTYKMLKIDKVNNLEIRVTDLLIDSLSHLDKSRFYYTKDIAVHISDHSYNTKDGMYTIKFKELEASSRGKFAKMKELRVLPRFPELEFSRKYKFQKDRFSMIFTSLELDEIDFRKLNVQRKLFAKRLKIGNSEISSFINRELPTQEIDKGRNFPQLALKRFDLKTLIDTVLIHDVNVRYTEYNPKTSKKGTVFFNKINGKILNVTNDSLSLLKNNWCKANFSTLFMGRGALKLKINFNLTDPQASFNFSGRMGEFNMRALNTLTRHLALVQVRSGVIREMEFDVKANYNRATGSLKILYKDLKIKVLKMNEEENKIEAKGLVSLVANLLVIENENPTGDDPARIGTIAYTRPKAGSFFNLMWKSLLTGMKESFGLSKTKEQRIQKRVEKLEDATKKLNHRNEDRKKEKDRDGQRK